ncbi:hypothetical protein Aperf_G00000108247 [Anoplocephala perfoliata]
MRQSENPETNQDSHLTESATNERNIPFTSPLLIAAARANNVERVLVLLNEKSRIQEVESGRNHGTALHHAAAMNSLECVKVLIEKGSPLRAKDSFGCTPLSVAAVHGHVEVIRYFGWLVPRTELISLAEEALPFAALRRHVEAYKILLKYIIGIDISRDVCGVHFLEHVVLATPHSMADFLKDCITNGNTSIEEAMQDPEILYFLLKVAFGAVVILGMLIQFEEAYLMNSLAQIAVMWPIREVQKFVFLIQHFGSAVAIGLILIFLILSAIVLIGILALCSRGECLAEIYIIAIALLSAVELALIICLLTVPGQFMMSINYVLDQTLEEFPEGSGFNRASQGLWNIIGSDGEDLCCGMTGYRDFARIPSDVSLPLPCCNWNFTNSHGQLLICTEKHAARKNIIGCNEKIVKFVEQNRSPFTAILCCIFTVQVIVIAIVGALRNRWRNSYGEYTL